MKSLALLTFTMLLTGCGGWGTQGTAPITHDMWDNRFHNQRMAEADFRLEVIRFEDVRHPRDKAPDYQDNLMYEYNPDDLLSGVNYRIPVLLEKHFNFNNVEDPIYRVEVELSKLRTTIRTAGWLEGPFGEYEVELDAEVLVRRPDSSLLFREDFSFKIDRARSGGKGRGPSAKQDRERLYDLTEDVIRQIAQKVAWRTRREHLQWQHDQRAAERAREEELNQTDY